MRNGIAYRDQMARKEPTKAEHWTWIGGFRRQLGDALREAQPPRQDAAVEEYKLALGACRKALNLAAKGKSTAERDNAQSCLDELANLLTATDAIESSAARAMSP
jgi:phosphoglycolate phosphatase-like HAD superfamily hydrolase